MKNTSRFNLNSLPMLIASNTKGDDSDEATENVFIKMLFYLNMEVIMSISSLNLVHEYIKNFEF
ncbi:hypothetical protein [uncultured Kordia sp.]|uniref:hypothetical protein n=1 Tax=uncultured Kordia sp. TaxID=507699 RepID=UPI0026166091|nr:hypothetical protein [uncultured Kordia sp.]